MARTPSYEEPSFIPATFNIAIWKDADLIDCNTARQQLVSSLMLNWEDRNSLAPGKYTLMVDPKWNHTVNADPEYSKVMVDIYCNHKVDIKLIEDDKGIE